MASKKDLDFMVSNMSGTEFATYVTRYLHEVLGEPLKEVGVIEARQDQSKHLETATITVFGVPLDFVAPRAEIYTDDSRIPEIVSSTPENDAKRRDLTINAVFFDVLNDKLEDFTGKGIEDLKNGVLRAPQDSKQMLMDDPLRIFRSVRFSSKLGFAIDPELLNAAKDPEVQTALKKKISRERVTEEVKKMLTGPNPRGAMELIASLGLREYVFNLPSDYKEFDMNQNNPHHEFSVWGHLMEALGNLQKIIASRNIADSDKLVLNLAIICHDIGKLCPDIVGTKELEGQLINTYHGHEEKSMEAAEYMLKGLPGITNKEIERVKGLIDAARRVNSDHTDGSEACNKADKALRKFVQFIQDDWENAIDLATADASAHKAGELDKFNRTYYNSMKGQISALGPEKIKNIKPLLNGNEIMAMFGRKGGPWMNQVITELLDWQNGSPTATKEDAIVEIKNIYNKLGLDKSSKIASNVRYEDEEVFIPKHLQQRKSANYDELMFASVWLKYPAEGVSCFTIQIEKYRVDTKSSISNKPIVKYHVRTRIQDTTYEDNSIIPRNGVLAHVLREAINNLESEADSEFEKQILLAERFIEKHLVAQPNIITAAKADAFPKKCNTCGRIHGSKEEFMALPFKEKVYDGPSELDPGRQCMVDWGITETDEDLIYRDCSCGSTLTIFDACAHKKVTDSAII